MAWYALGRLAQQLDTGIRQQGLLSTRLFEGMLDERLELRSFHDGFQLQTQLDSPGERSIWGSRQQLSQARVAEHPYDHQVTGIEGEIEEGRQIPEKGDGQILCLVDDPYGHDAFTVGECLDMRLDIAP